MKNLLVFAFILSSLNLFAQESAWYYEQQLLDSTKGIFVERFREFQETGFQVAYDADSVYLLINDPRQLGIIFKGLGNRLTMGDNANFYNKRKIRRVLTEQFLIKYSDKSSRYQKRKEKYFKRVLRAKARFRSDSSWFYLAFPKTADNNISFMLSRWNRAYAEMNFHNASAVRMEEFPWFRNAVCTPLERWSEFLNGTAFGPRSYGNIEDYLPKRVQRSKRKFELFFDKNSIEYNAESLRKIEAFLASNDLRISKTLVEAYSSVEGDRENNIRLHKQRAMVLMKALSRYIDDNLNYEVIARENWDLFNRQIENNDLPDISEEEWKDLLVLDSIQQELEPLLQEQRKAVLTLYLYRPLPVDEMTAEIMDDVRHQLLLLDRLHVQSKQRKKHLLELLSIRRYALNKGNINEWKNLLLQMDEEIQIPKYHIYALFDMMMQPHKLQGPTEVKKQLAIKAFNDAIVRFDQYPHNIYTQSDLLTIQRFLYQSIERGDFDAETIYDMYIPEKDRFVNLLLNHMEFEAKLYREGHLQREERIASSDDWEIDPRYYYLLKKIAMGDVGTKLRSLAVRSDWFLEFDLGMFLMINLHHHNAFTGKYYDPEIGLEEMHKVLKRLISVRKKMCPYQLDMIKVSFYQAVVQQSGVRQVKSELVHEALEFFEDYYRKNEQYLTPQERHDLARQIIVVNNYCYFNEAKVFADWLMDVNDDRMAKQ